MSGRNLTVNEIELARSIFGSLIDYSTVKVYNENWRMLGLFDLGIDRPHAPNGSIYFPTVKGQVASDRYSKDFALEKDPELRATFIHEMAHVWQHQRGINLPIRIAEEAKKYGKEEAYNYDNIFSGKFYPNLPSDQRYLKLPLEAQAHFLENLYQILDHVAGGGTSSRLDQFRSVAPPQILQNWNSAFNYGGELDQRQGGASPLQYAPSGPSESRDPFSSILNSPSTPTPQAPDLPIDPINFNPLTAPSPLTSVTPLKPASLSDFRNDWDASYSGEAGQYSASSGRGGSGDIYGGSSWGGSSSGQSSGGGSASGGGAGSSSGGSSTGGGRRSGGFASTPQYGPTPSSRPSDYSNWNGPDEGVRANNASSVRGSGSGGKGGSRGVVDPNGPGNSKGPKGTNNGTNPNKGNNPGNLRDALGSGAYYPVLLDISGDGLKIESIDSSSRFIDLEGNGYQSRTAWVAQGTGVLVLDADGDGKISRSSEFVFTEWDSSAASDLEALKHVFDTNGNGKLDAGDAQWSKFRVEVNGQLVTLDSLGITSIDLTPKGSGQTFNDGSAITGTTTFTRADGTTGTVGDAQLVANNSAYIVRTTSTTKADSSIEKTILAYNKDGSLAFRNVVTTSADGKSVQTQFDDDGNGTFDRSQTNMLTADASGLQTKTVSNFNADGSLSDRTTTVTSADHLTVTTTLDQDGDGIADQRQTFVKSADGSTTTTTQQLSVNGTVLFGTAVNGSADGLTKTTSLDRDGNGAYDNIVTETTTVAADGTRKKTTKETSANGKNLSIVYTTTSADGRTITVETDADGNGPTETKTVTTSTTAASGDVTLDTIVYNTNASFIKRSKSTTVTTANGLSKTTTSDLNADNVIDFTDTDVTVI
ncbi:hypothetical protein GGD57_003817, partial [Rhizobium esperanzae]|nr:hypothetical protein [Rhizobium esperanzae]